MKTINWMLALVLLGFAGSNSAWADHGRHHGHVFVGIGVGPYWGWGPWYYPPYGYSYPYYPPVVVTQAAPPVYVEQTPAPSAQTNYWYYCAASRAYYPYVKECPGGWQQVVPQPPQH